MTKAECRMPNAASFGPFLHPQRDRACQRAHELLAIDRFRRVAGVQAGAEQETGSPVRAIVDAAQIEGVIADEAGFLKMPRLWKNLRPGLLPDGGAFFAEMRLQAVKAAGATFL